MLNLWVFVISRIGGLLAMAWILGALVGSMTGWATILLSGYLLINLRNLYRLNQWLHVRKLDSPDARGLWGEVFYQIYRLQRRNRKRKRKLTEMLRRFQNSTAAMPDATVVLNAQHRIEWFNKAAGTLLGLQTSQDIGSPINNLLRHPAFTHYLHRDPHTIKDTSIKIPSPLNPQSVLRIHLVPYDTSMRLLIARDVTEMQRLEQVRQDFVANVSHELRTPLTVITGFIETMQDSLAESAHKEWEYPLALMAQQASRMQNIVNDLLLLSRLESEVPPNLRKTVDVPNLLKDIVAAARALSGDQAHFLDLSIDQTLRIYGQPDEITSAFSNLVFNAVRYTPAQGRITIRWYHDEYGAHFEVEDTGEGIDAQHLPRLTERFYRVDVGRSRNHGGTGLGLAIVKHVLQRHHAKLHIQSQLSKGSLFSCTFPPASIAN
ncbi:MAG: phosphate regulon sensor histidine kinase PhoR [Pseudomonadota bacterium]|jgi:two-component system phosphate regulon sensor histidine kinase PhoR